MLNIHSYLEAEGRKCDEIRIRMIDWPHTNSYVITHMCQFVGTLFYSIPLLALTHRQTDGQTDRQRVKYTCFAWAGGTCPRFALAGGTFFPVVLLCQFLVLAGNRFCFWFWREIVFGVTYVLSVQYITTGKKSSSRLSGGLWCNEYVLVLAKIDLIHFEHSICISSTWIKTNTNPLFQLQHFCYI